MEQNLIAKINDNELEMADRYIDAYAITEGAERTAGIEYILRVWNTAKSKYLSKMFEDGLILSRQVEIARDKTEMMCDIDRLWNHDHFCMRFQNEFYKKLVYPYTSIQNDEDKRKIGHNLELLVDSAALVENVYNGDTVEIDAPNGKPFKIQHGAKILKTLGKIVTLFNLDNENYENFRISHSQILNQKSFTGTLCLSIHPLDYMTMSDNECQWTSCMSWENGGCYRQGTVEMMNSDCVVVAYLKSAEDMQMPGFFGNHHTWNSKKWRELFIVTPEMISNIKGYPYQNSNLSKYVINWLKDCAEKAGIGQYRDASQEWIPWNSFMVGNKTISIDPITQYMYNDFNGERTQYAYFSDEIPEGKFVINYSGDSECMACGGVDVTCSSEGNLIGECCENYYECEECGERFYNEDDIVEIDGHYLCRDCVDNHCEEDALMGDLHMDYDMSTIHLMVNNKLYKYESIRVFADNFYNDYNIKRYFPYLYRATEAFHGDYCTLYVRGEELTEEGWELFGYDDINDFNSCKTNDYDYEIRKYYEPIEVNSFGKLTDKWVYEKDSVYSYEM